jgi:hypothetical protein
MQHVTSKQRSRVIEVLFQAKRDHDYKRCMAGRVQRERNRQLIR